MEIKEFVNMRKQTLKNQIASMDKKPTLMIIQANDDPASNAYVRGKLKDGDEIRLFSDGRYEIIRNQED